MFIFKDIDNLFKVAQDKTHAIVVFKDIRTKEYRQSVEDIRELLFCDYAYSLYPKSYNISDDTEQIGGRRWCSFKFAIARYFNIPEEEKFNFIRNPYQWEKQKYIQT